MIPLFYFLIAWMLFLALYGLMSLISMYQLMRFGIAQSGTWLATVTFCTVGLLVVIGTGVLLLNVDWNQSLDIFGAFSANAPAYLQ